MKDALPVAPFISGGIVRNLTWIQQPLLTHLCGDMVWKVVGQGIGRIYYFDEVSIEHNHPFRSDKKILPDDTHKFTNSQKNFINDNEAFKRWLHDYSHLDIEKARRAVRH